MVLNFFKKVLSKIKFFLHISKCYRGWYLQMQTLTSMYTIGGWKLPSLEICAKKVCYIQSYHTLILI